MQRNTVNVIGPTLVINKDSLSLLHSSFIILLNYAEKTLGKFRTGYLSLKSKDCLRHSSSDTGYLISIYKGNHQPNVVQLSVREKLYSQIVTWAMFSK